MLANARFSVCYKKKKERAIIQIFSELQVISLNVSSEDVPDEGQPMNSVDTVFHGTGFDLKIIFSGLDLNAYARIETLDVCEK